MAMRLNRRVKKLEKAINPSDSYFIQAATPEEADHEREKLRAENPNAQFFVFISPIIAKDWNSGK